MKKSYRSILILLLVLFSLFSVQLMPAAAQSEQPSIVVITLEGPLTPVWSGYLRRGINTAVEDGASLVVVNLNTPGGGINLMNSLVQQILASPVPVVVYVSPRGSMAASAGTMLVLAGQIGAMSPECAIGAASPVGLQGEDIGTTEEEKTKEILKATARSLAQRRGPEAVDLVEAAIDSARAASSEEALDAGLIDFIARDLTELLTQIDGKTITLNGNEVVLNTKNARVIPVATTMVEDVLGLLTNPNITFLLLAVGVQALLIELSSPGGWFAGFTGAVLLALAIYGLGILPVNWFGLIFLLIAFVLFILDIKAPTHGALTAAGTGSFIAGALILFNSVRVPGFPPVSIGLVIGVGLFLGLTFFAVVMIAVRAMKTRVITGRETLIGKIGFVVSRIDTNGIVQVAGEQWSAVLAKGQAPLIEGDRIIVDQVEGVRLIVKKAE